MLAMLPSLSHPGKMEGMDVFVLPFLLVVGFWHRQPHGSAHMGRRDDAERRRLGEGLPVPSSCLSSPQTDTWRWEGK